MTRILVLGGGYSGRAILVRARESHQEAIAVVRREERAAELGAERFRAIVMPVFGPDLARHVDGETHVIVTFPPDGETDARVAESMPSARAITYLSASSVYGDRRGVIDDATPVTTTPTPSGARRLLAEEVWAARGAAILRCPAIYGDDRGLHARILAGKHRMPGDGSGFVSRIHVDDLAELALASARRPGETFVVSDLEPLPHREVVALVCEAFGAAAPPSVPIEEVHETLRGDRRIDGARALTALGVTLRHPTYRAFLRDVAARRRPAR